MLPVLVVFFNRKDTLLSVLESLKEYRPRELYLACDGPRSWIDGESRVVEEVRKSALDFITWDCDVKTLFRSENFGCKKAVHEAIQWFFSCEHQGVVLEDDIVPCRSFFEFAEKALNYYNKDKKIGTITGRNEFSRWGQNDIFFTNRFQCWGWASWSDRILGMNVNYGYSPEIDYSEIFKNVSWEERLFLHSVLGLLQSHQVNSWAYPYDLNFRRKGQYHIYPQYNLVKNIGFGNVGTHSSSRDSDSVAMYEGFVPEVIESFGVRPDSQYSKEKLRSEYGNVYMLFVMRYVRYFGWARRPWRKIRQSVKQIFPNARLNDK